MMNEEKIKILLEDIVSQYMIGYFNDDLDTEAEKWGQIQILEWILSQSQKFVFWGMILIFVRNYQNFFSKFSKQTMNLSIFSILKRVQNSGIMILAEIDYILYLIGLISIL